VWSRIGCLAQYLRVNSEKGPSGAGSQFASRSVPGDPAPAYNVSEPRSSRWPRPHSAGHAHHVV